MPDTTETIFVEKITYNGPHIITSTSSQGYSFSFSSSETFEVKIESNFPNNEIKLDKM